MINLAKLSSEDAFCLLGDIPSDEGSFTSEAPSEDELENNDELVDDNFEDTGLDAAIDDQDITHTQNTSLDWDSEDDIPLANLVNQQEEIKWMKTTQYSEPEPFNEPFGPNIPESAETPLDVLEGARVNQKI